MEWTEGKNQIQSEGKAEYVGLPERRWSIAESKTLALPIKSYLVIVSVGCKDKDHISVHD